MLAPPRSRLELFGVFRTEKLPWAGLLTLTVWPQTAIKVGYPLSRTYTHTHGPGRSRLHSTWPGLMGMHATLTPLGIRALWPLPDIFFPHDRVANSHRLAANSHQSRVPPTPGLTRADQSCTVLPEPASLLRLEPRDRGVS